MASTDPDTMYYHQAMKETREHFKESVQKEIEDNEHNHPWEITLIEEVPKVTEFRQPLQVQSHLEMPRILVQLGHTQRT